MITSAYNRSQLALQFEQDQSRLKLQAEQQKSNRQTAEANASMAYLEFLARDPAPTDEQRDQATLAIAAVLPPELSFSLAVDRLPEEPKILALLTRTEEDVWPYVAPHLETDPPAQNVLKFLDDQQLIDDAFGYLTSPGNARAHRRLQAFIQYFTFITRDRTPIQKRRASDLVDSLYADSEIDRQLRADLAIALALSFANYEVGNTDYADVFTNATESFWVGIDISHGELPGPLKTRLFAEHFSSDVHGPHQNYLDLVSQQLLTRLQAVKLTDIPVRDIGRILYSYCMLDTEYPNYLQPDDALRFMENVLAAASTPTRKQQLSMELGSMSGEILYRRSIGKKPELKRKYALMTIEWYEKHAKDDWYIPKFLHYAEEDFPDLKSRIASIFKRV